MYHFFQFIAFNIKCEVPLLSSNDDYIIKMDILKAEIERKRKQLEEKELLVTVANCPTSRNYRLLLTIPLQAPGKKYFKRADLVAKETEEYRKKYGQLKTEDTESTKEAIHGKQPVMQ